MQVTVWPRGLNRTVVSGPLGITWSFIPKFDQFPINNSEIGELLSVKFSTRYEDGFGGHDQAEWLLRPFGGYIGGMFRPGDHVRIMIGGGNAWEGEFTEAAPNDDGTVLLKGRGYAYDLTTSYDSLFLNVTPSPDVSYPTNQLTGGNLSSTWYGYEWATLIAGMPISQVVGTMPSGPFGIDAVAPNPVYVGTVLTAQLQELGKRWAVWGRTLKIAADSTTPMWGFDAPKSLVGVTDQEYYSHIGVWYVSTAPGTSLNEWSVAWWPGSPPVGDDTLRFDVRTKVVDRRGLGLMTLGRATGLAQQLYEQVKGRFIISGSFTITPKSGFRSAGGGEVGDQIAFIKASDPMSLADIRTSQANLMVNAVELIGKTEYTWTAPTMGGEPEQATTITLLGSAPRNLAEILKDIPPDAAGELAGAADAA